MKFNVVSSISIALLFLNAGCFDRKEDSAVITILAAASTTNLVDDLTAEFQLQHPTLKVVVSYGASSALAEKIAAGVPADIFISANSKWAKHLERAGLIQESSAWLSNHLVVIVPINSPTTVRTVAGLDSPEFRRIAIASPAVPAGSYAEQVLSKSGILENLKKDGKLVRGSDVRSVVAYVQRGEVDAGIVYLTDANIASGVRMKFRIDPQQHDEIEYRLLRTNTNNPNADPFYQFMQSDRGKALAMKHGFIVASESR